MSDDSEAPRDEESPEAKPERRRSAASSKCRPEQEREHMCHGCLTDSPFYRVWNKKPCCKQCYNQLRQQGEVMGSECRPELERRMIHEPERWRAGFSGFAGRAGGDEDHRLRMIKDADEPWVIFTGSGSVSPKPPRQVVICKACFFDESLMDTSLLK